MRKFPAGLLLTLPFIASPGQAAPALSLRSVLETFGRDGDACLASPANALGRLTSYGLMLLALTKVSSIRCNVCFFISIASRCAIHTSTCSRFQ